MDKHSFKNSFKKKYNRVSKSLLSFSKTLPGEITKIISIIVIVLLLSWGVTKATTNEFEQATNNFSVIGTVSSLSDTTISLIDARGSDTKEEELYNLNIEHLSKIETKDYAPLIISDIRPGDTIIAQGVTNGSIFFITRIVSFSDVVVLPTQDTATTTPEQIASSTEEIATTTSTEDSGTTGTDESEESSSDDTATTTPEQIASSTEEIATTTSTEDSGTPNVNENATSTIIDTVAGIVEQGVDAVSDVLDVIIDTITGSQESEFIPVSNEEPVTESPPNIQ